MILKRENSPRPLGDSPRCNPWISAPRGLSLGQGLASRWPKWGWKRWNEKKMMERPQRLELDLYQWDIPQNSYGQTYGTNVPPF